MFNISVSTISRDIDYMRDEMLAPIEYTRLSAVIITRKKHSGCLPFSRAPRTCLPWAWRKASFLFIGTHHCMKRPASFWTVSSCQSPLTAVATDWKNGLWFHQLPPPRLTALKLVEDWKDHIKGMRKLAGK